MQRNNPTQENKQFYHNLTQLLELEEYVNSDREEN